MPLENIKLVIHKKKVENKICNSEKNKSNISNTEISDSVVKISDLVFKNLDEVIIDGKTDNKSNLSLSQLSDNTLSLPKTAFNILVNNSSNLHLVISSNKDIKVIKDSTPSSKNLKDELMRVYKLLDNEYKMDENAMNLYNILKNWK